MFFDSYWASYKIISLGPTRSMETIFQKKKAIFQMKNNKQFWTLPSRSTEYGRPQETFYWAT